jgi:hypothetical protein
MSRLTNRAFFRAQTRPDPDAGLGPIGCESAPNFVRVTQRVAVFFRGAITSAAIGGDSALEVDLGSNRSLVYCNSSLRIL